MALKKVVVALASDMSLKSVQLGKLAKKSILCEQYASGDTEVETLPEAATVQYAALAEYFSSGADGVAVVTLQEADFAQGIAAITEAVDRNTLVVLVGKDAVYFQGAGVSREIDVLQRPVQAKDIVPTLCYMSGAKLPRSASGAVLYEVMKDRDSPFTEIALLKTSIEGMKAAMERNTREAWDKHDCA